MFKAILITLILLIAGLIAYDHAKESKRSANKNGEPGEVPMSSNGGDNYNSNGGDGNMTSPPAKHFNPLS